MTEYRPPPDREYQARETGLLRRQVAIGNMANFLGFYDVTKDIHERTMSQLKTLREEYRKLSQTECKQFYPGITTKNTRRITRLLDLQTAAILKKL